MFGFLLNHFKQYKIVVFISTFIQILKKVCVLTVFLPNNLNILIWVLSIISIFVRTGTAFILTWLSINPNSYTYLQRHCHRIITLKHKGPHKGQSTLLFRKASEPERGEMECAIESMCWKQS